MKDIRCLIISHAFNMDGRAASQTITDKIPFLLERNWKIWVLSAITGIRDTRFPHRQLFALGPSGFRFDFRHWCSIRFGRGWVYRILTATVSALLLPLIIIERIIIGYSSQWSWTIPAVFHGVVWIKKYKINVIYSSGGAWSAHLAGWCLKRLTGVRWIAEIHDPLVKGRDTDDQGSALRLTREERFRRTLERRICSDVYFCWWFTSGALKSAQARNPALGKRGFFMLPGALSPKNRLPYKAKTKLNLAHFGSLSDSRSIAPLLEGIPEFFSTIPESVDKIKLEVFGTSLDSRSQRSLRELRLTDSVVCHGRLEFNEETGLSGRDQVLRLMQQCDYLLLLHGDDEFCAEYIPSKLYEYWWANRPILALTHQNPQLDELILTISPLNFVAHVEDGAPAIQALLGHAWSKWSTGEITAFSRERQPLTPKDTVIKIDHLVRSDA